MAASMQTVHAVAALRDVVRGWKRDGGRVAFAPTMGNLHAGHHALIGIARGHADHVVASVFVNPAQFGPDEDFVRYPRTLDADAEGLAANGCDLLFAPTVEPSSITRYSTASKPATVRGNSASVNGKPSASSKHGIWISNFMRPVSWHR